jgi:hypothetical protein
MANPTPTAIRLLPVPATKALLAIDGPASATFNTIITATNAYEGSAGNLITLAGAVGGTWVPNIGTLTLTGVGVANETVTIGSTVYTWKAAPTTTAFEVKIGADAAACVTNLVAAINLGSGAGTLYGSATTVHPTVRAYDGAGDTVVVHTKSNSTLTAVGTLIATTETMTNGSWGATTLADGTDGTNVTISVTGTAISYTFADGYSTVSDFEAALAASAAASALVSVTTAGTTPLYQLVNTSDEFAATKLAGGGATTSAAPTALSATAGVALPFCCDQALVLLKSVAGSGTMTADVRLWGFSPATLDWYAIGQLNAAVAIAEVGADRIAYCELLVGLRRFSRLYAQIVSLGGTATEIEVYADCSRAEPVSR